MTRKPSIRADLADPIKREELKLEASYLVVAVLLSLALAMNVHLSPKPIKSQVTPLIGLLCDTQICIA